MTLTTHTDDPLRAPIRWPAEAIWQAVVPALPGFTVEVLPKIDSTNSELMRRFRATAAAGDPAGPETVLLVAEQQTAGRGRLGRPWRSAAGASLTFSLGLPLRPADWSGLSLAVGLSLAESLAPATDSAPTLQLKWPNDLWLNQCKLGGILVETASWGDQRYVVIGVGLNVTQPAEDLPTTTTATATPASAAAGSAPTATEAPAPAPATSLQALWPGVDAAWALQTVAAPLVAAVLAFERSGFAPLAARFAARDALAGRLLSVSDGRQGTACGVSPQGALRLRCADGLHEITSHEVSVRPAALPLKMESSP